MSATEIATSRWKLALYLAGSLAFVAIALRLPPQPHRDAWKLQLGIGFFGLCAVVFAWLLIRPQRLALDAEGFTLLGGFVASPKKVCWRDIDEFFIYRLPRGGKMIGFNYKPGVRPVSPLVRPHRLRGADGALPKGWARSPEEMVAELNAYRRRALGAAGAAGAAGAEI
jgi:hypothetical protein